MRIILETYKRVEATVDVDLTGTVSKKPRIAEVVVDNGCVVDPVATPNDGSVIYRISKTHTRSKISSIWLDESEPGGLQAALAICADNGSEPSTCCGVWCVWIKAAEESA